MMFGGTLVTFALATASICAVPGPTVLFIISQGLRGSQSVLIYSILGIIVANLIWISISCFGFAALLLQSVHLFTALQMAGSLYLVYLAIKTWRGAFEMYREPNQIPIANSAVDFRQGFFTSMSNPKALLFYLLFFPQFVDIELPLLPQFLIFAGLTLAIFVSVFALYGYLATFLAIIIASPRVNAILRIVMSVSLVWVAADIWFFR
jgi:threonine/homoserine/homoserine lactone efflux protein